MSVPEFSTGAELLRKYIKLSEIEANSII